LAASPRRRSVEMATTIEFVCAHCDEPFEEPVQAFVDHPGEVAPAPALCVNCGHGEEDEED
jgi:hypothetical protein